MSCKPRAPEKEVAGLVKFFSKPEYMSDFLEGRLYCNTPQYYRDSSATGVGDDFEACLAYFSASKHAQRPRVVIDGEPIDLTEVKSLLIFREVDKSDAHLHCWTALAKPVNLAEAIKLQEDLSQIQREFGNDYVLLPVVNIDEYGRLLDEATPDGYTGSHVQYTDDWRVRGMFRKRSMFSYQREYRFAIGQVPKGHLPYRTLTIPPPRALVKVRPSIWLTVDGQRIQVLKPIAVCDPKPLRYPCAE